jgi:hypothetical protein|tara:strand:- start:151 stop:417 length:267 start_codon:yes stop_codon:yes gene_type:complete
LDYEDDIFVLFEKRVVDFEVERTRSKLQAKLDFEIMTGAVDENGKRKKKKKKTKKKKKNSLKDEVEVESEEEEATDYSAILGETGRAK